MGSKRKVKCPNCGFEIEVYKNPFPTVDIIIEVPGGVVLIERKNPPHGWAIPGGFVGVEFADDIAAMGKEVTIIELLPHCLLLNFDEEFAVLAEEELKKRGVNIITGARVKELKGDRRVKAVVLEDGKEIPCDLVIISVGTKPNIDIAQKCGLKIHELGAIDVDEYLRTSDPNIFAVGDCSIKRDFLTGKPMIAMLASIAAMEGRIVASNILGLTKARRMPGVVFVCSTQVGELCLGAAGYTEGKGMLRRLSPGWLIAIGFVLLVTGAVLPILMMLHIMRSTYLLNGISVVSTMSGLIIGMYGVFELHMARRGGR